MTHDVYRDKNGDPVTITQDQFNAIWHAIGVRNAVMQEAGHPPDDIRLGPGTGGVNYYKSRLLGRMLFDGRPPLPEPPPLDMGGPAYWLTDPDLCPVCGGERAKPGGNIGTTIVPPTDQTLEFFGRHTHVPEGESIETIGAWSHVDVPDSTTGHWEYQCIMGWHPPV